MPKIVMLDSWPASVQTALTPLTIFSITPNFSSQPKHVLDDRASDLVGSDTRSGCNVVHLRLLNHELTPGPCLDLTIFWLSWRSRSRADKNS